VPIPPRRLPLNRLQLSEILALLLEDLGFFRIPLIPHHRQRHAASLLLASS